MDSRQLREAALYYHREPKPGKIAVTPIKQLTNQYDLSLAYSPGVAFACEEIVADPREASTLPEPIWSVSSPTVQPFSAWAPSAHLPPSR